MRRMSFGAMNFGSNTPSVTASLNVGLIAYYRMDETSAGSSPVGRLDAYSTNHLTDNGNIASATGIVNNGALLVAASNKYFSRTTNATLNPTVATWCFWVKHTNTAGAQAYFSKDGGNGNDQQFVAINNAGTISFTISTDNGAAQNFVSVAGPSAGTFSFICCMYDGAKIRISVDLGAFQETVFPGAMNTAVTTADFRIGLEFTSGTAYLNGVIDEFGFWNRALTQTEVSRVWRVGLGSQYPF